MQAIVLNQAGGVDQLIYQAADMPVPQAGELLVKVKAFGINPMDVVVRSNEQTLTAFLGPQRPAILGWDVAGEVAGIGPDVSGFELGDAVFALSNGRAYAEYVTVSAAMSVHKPASVSYTQAAGVPVAAITAWQALVKRGSIKPGDRVLIQAGAGGVGHFAIQLAKHFGAYVATTASAKNHDFVRSLGADQVIDYTRDVFEQVLQEVDLVLDTLGGEIRERSLAVLKPGGTLVTIIPPLPEEFVDKAQQQGIQLTLLIGQSSTEDMQSLANLLATGAIKAHVSTVYSFDQITQAHQAIESKRTVGKIVVEIP